MFKIIILLYFIATSTIIDTARILAVFPSPTISHHMFFRVLINELLRRGHELVTITTDPVYSNGKAPENLTEIDIHDVSYNFYQQVIVSGGNESVLGVEMEWTLFQNSINNLFRIIEVQFKSDPVQEFVREKRKFDILLIEAYMRPAIVYSHLYKAPVILLSSLGATLENLENFGAPTHPILYPTMFRQRSYNFSIWDKLREYFSYVQYKYYQTRDEHLDNQALQRMLGPNAPSIAELNNNADMLFINYHPIWMDNQPMPPGIVFLGGLHRTPERELPEDLKLYLESSKYEVIYVSFGTTLSSYGFPKERLKIIIEGLSELRYDILFKWDNDEIFKGAKNIKVNKWYPQSDILRHPNIKVFIMQGGIHSTEEAITAGVPLVGIPMIGDQWYNSAKYVQLKIGLKLDFLTFTKLDLKNAVEIVVSNISYRENIIKLRERMNDQFQSSLERAVWWIEYVLRHGGARHLRTPAANMSWAEYYELELILIVLTCLFISIIIGLFISISLWRYVSQFVSSKLKVKRS